MRRVLSLALIGVCLGLLLAALSWPSVLRVAHFSTRAPSDTIPSDWAEIRFGQNESGTDYALVDLDSVVAVQAQSKNGSSALITHPRIDLEEHPIIEWKWRVEDLPADADIAADTTDDAGARLYVTFDYQGLGIIDRAKLMLLRKFGYEKAPSRAINYVWATNRKRSTVVPSPYTDQIMMMSIRSGTDRTGEWVRERRNVLADYRQLFGGTPPPVNGVALMTDTDNTAGTARAFYGDIVFRSEEADARMPPASSKK